VVVNDSGARLGFPPIVRGRGSRRREKPISNVGNRR
jgi:hypothetical protein